MTATTKRLKKPSPKKARKRSTRLKYELKMQCAFDNGGLYTQCPGYTEAKNYSWDGPFMRTDVYCEHRSGEANCFSPKMLLRAAKEFVEKYEDRT